MITKTKQEKLDTLEAVEARAFVELENVSPSDPTFNYILNNVGLLRQITELVRFGDPGLFTDPDEANRERVEPESAPEQTTEIPVEPSVTAPVEQPAMKLEDLRAKMITLAQTGLDLESLMNGMGYANLSSIPPERYGDLLAKAEAMMAKGEAE